MRSESASGSWRECIREVGRHPVRHAYGHRGDFNMKPLDAVPLIEERVDLEVSATGRPTCVGTEGTESEIDVLIISKAL